MRQELYIPLRDRIVKVVPKIMELRAGCHTSIGTIAEVYESEGEKKIVTSTSGQWSQNTV